MPQEWSPLIVAVAAALLAFVLGLLRLSHDTKVARNEELRRRRVEAYAAFCAAAIDYRRATLNQWYVRLRHGGKEAAARAEPEVGEDVRASRATAWSRYYEVVLLCNDAAIAEAADAALQSAAAISDAPTEQEKKRLSDLVHEQVAAFAEVAGEAVRARDQGSAMPPRHAGTAGTAA